MSCVSQTLCVEQGLEIAQYGWGVLTVDTVDRLGLLRADGVLVIFIREQ